MNSWANIWLASAATLVMGCGKDGDGSGELDGGFAISVKPLTLPGIGEALYTLRLWNADAALVWEQEHMASTRFGDGKGALSYVGPCDASRNPHMLEVSIEKLIDVDGKDLVGTWVNPAPIGQPLQLAELVCAENADVAVVVNLAIMRDAQQGFFDVAVNFEDIFCSAKFDCLGEDGLPSDLLHNPATEERDVTVVLGFACTAGASQGGTPEQTWLHLTDVHLACDGAPDIWFEPDGTTGNNGPRGPDQELFQTGIYRGAESLPGWDKCYWNMAFGVNLATARDCHLTVQGTASHESWADDGGGSPANTIWPYVSWDIPLTEGGALACGREALNGPSGRVATAYTGFGGASFGSEWRCGADTIEPHTLACDGTFPGGTPLSATPTPEDLSVSIGGVRSSSFVLPEGYYFAANTTCCVDSCCGSGPTDAP